MEDIKDIESSKIEEYLSKLGDWALNKGFQLVLALANVVYRTEKFFVGVWH